MHILIIGGGGREHALAWKISQSKLTEKLYIAPGNAGTQSVGENVALQVDDFEGIAKLCKEKRIDLVVVGPEVPLVKGLREFLEGRTELAHVHIVGPGSSGARLEGSKDFSKQFMVRHGIPTAAARTFTANEIQEGLAYLAQQPLPIVLKADGLAAGKGVIICTSHEEALENFKDMLANKKFGDASARVLVEEFLDGIELSVFVLTDGKEYVILPEAKDYKRIGEHDTGPNTGGMGAVSPVIFADKWFMQEVETRIIRPTIHGLNKEKISYRGFIFFGLIRTSRGPYVIEYNARMGDPETEAVMTRIDEDLVPLLWDCARGALTHRPCRQDPAYAVTVVMVAGGYPGAYEKGKVISIGSTPTDAATFHAGTRIKGNEVVTDGGRVIAVTGRGKDLAEARKNAFGRVGSISWPGVYFRKDIGLDLQKMEESHRKMH